MLAMADTLLLALLYRNLLDAVGFNVYREYYVNDAGRQMNILTTSVWLRYLSLMRRGHRISG